MTCTCDCARRLADLEDQVSRLLVRQVRTADYLRARLAPDARAVIFAPIPAGVPDEVSA